jgi:iron-sulfur cluster assembly protein
MLIITPEALAVMRRVTAHPKMKPTSGLRIAHQNEPSAPLAVQAVHGPHPGDRLLERDGARLYLGPGTVGRVEDGTLDAVTQSDGRVQFVLEHAA